MIKPIFDSLHPPCIRNIKSNGAHTSLVNTTSRIAYNTIIAQTNESITAREVHGLLLCAGNTIRFVEGFIECNIPLSGCNIEADAPSQIVTLSSPPCNSKSCMEKYQISLGNSTSTRITVQDGGNQHNKLCSHHSYNEIRILTSGKCSHCQMTQSRSWRQNTTNTLSTLINPWCMIARINNKVVISLLNSLMCRMDLHQSGTNLSTSNYWKQLSPGPKSRAPTPP